MITIAHNHLFLHASLAVLLVVQGCATTSEHPPSPTQSASLAPTASQVLDSYTRAIGGREPWEKHTSRTQRVQLYITGGFNADGDPNNILGEMVFLRKAPDKLLTTTALPSIGSFQQGYDGRTGWAIDPTSGPRLLEGAELAELRSEAQFNKELDFRRSYSVAEMVGPLQVGGRACWQLRLTRPDGAKADAFFDQETGLCTAISRNLSAGDQVLQVTRFFKNYTDFDGMLFPARTEQSLGRTEQVETLTAVSGEAIDDSAFELPAQIQALRAARARVDPAPPAPR